MDAPRYMKKEYERIALKTKGHYLVVFQPGDIPLSSEGFFCMDVTDNTTDDQEIFFIPPPKYARASLFPFYRATSRSLAYPYEENVKNRNNRKKSTMPFLKGPGQEDSQRTARGAVIYRMLKEQDVDHVASIRLGGDVPGLEAETQEWIEELPSKSKYLKCKMVCHHLILNTVARDLSTFAWCKVLLSCIADAVEGAQQAYKAGILHRDLSASNIMIVKDKETQEWRGILIDWDTCLLWRKHGSEPRSGRTGTWAFISLRILQNEGPTVRHTLWDDIESAFWVLIYEALLYLKHATQPGPLHRKMQTIFSLKDYLPGGSVIGGPGKLSVLALCALNVGFSGLAKFENLGVNKLLDQLGKVFMERYSEDGKTSFTLDDPDEAWFSESLRAAAMKMEPLSITPTAIKSPTNDSNPPGDLRTWQSANPKDFKVDYFPMPLDGDPEKSTQVRMRQANPITDTLIHGLDGSSLGKRHSEHVDASESSMSKRRK